MKHPSSDLYTLVRFFPNDVIDPEIAFASSMELFLGHDPQKETNRSNSIPST
jgi:hypothetical protein